MKRGLKAARAELERAFPATFREMEVRRRLVRFIANRGGSVSVRECAKSFRPVKDKPERAEMMLTGLIAESRGEWTTAATTSAGGRPTRRFRLFTAKEAKERDRLRQAGVDDTANLGKRLVGAVRRLRGLLARPKEWLHRPPMQICADPSDPLGMWKGYGMAIESAQKEIGTLAIHGVRCRDDAAFRELADAIGATRRAPSRRRKKARATIAHLYRSAETPQEQAHVAANGRRVALIVDHARLLLRFLSRPKNWQQRPTQIAAIKSAEEQIAVLAVHGVRSRDGESFRELAATLERRAVDPVDAMREHLAVIKEQIQRRNAPDGSPFLARSVSEVADWVGYEGDLRPFRRLLREMKFPVLFGKASPTGKGARRRETLSEIADRIGYKGSLRALRRRMSVGETSRVSVGETPQKKS